MSWSSRKKKEGIFCTVYVFVPFLSEGNFFEICVLSQCILNIVYWIHFQNMHTFTYQKALLYTLLLLASKIIESLQCILKFILWSTLPRWWFLKNLYIQIKMCMIVRLWELRSYLNWKDAGSSTEGMQEAL